MTMITTIAPTIRPRSRRPRWTAVALGFSALLATMLLAGILLVAGAAWACVVLPHIALSPRASAAPGAQLTVEGADFEQRVELRWNAVDGPLLATGPSPAFSVPVTLPDVAEGLYTLVAVERGPGGVAGNVARTAVQVARGGATPTTVKAAATTSSSSNAFAVTLGIAGALALLVVGGLAGARLARRKHSGAPPAPGTTTEQIDLTNQGDRP
jgi:hypothetical protein